MTKLETAGVLNTFTRSLACLAHCHPSVFPVLLAGLLGNLSCWKLLGCLRRYLSLCPFGFIGFLSATSKSILHHILLSQTESNNLIACGHTCMSGLERAAAAILGLVAAVKSLAFELGRARRQPSRQNRQTLVSGK